MFRPTIRGIVLLVTGLVVFSTLAHADEPGQSEREVMYYRYLEFASYVNGGSIEPHWMAARLWKAIVVNAPIAADLGSVTSLITCVAPIVTNSVVRDITIWGFASRVRSIDASRADETQNPPPRHQEHEVTQRRTGLPTRFRAMFVSSAYVTGSENRISHRIGRDGRGGTNEKCWPLETPRTTIQSKTRFRISWCPW